MLSETDGTVNCVCDRQRQCHEECMSMYNSVHPVISYK